MAMLVACMVLCVQGVLHSCPTGTADASCKAAPLPAGASTAVWTLLLGSKPPGTRVAIAPLEADGPHVWMADPANVTALSCDHPHDQYTLWSHVEGVLVVDAAVLQPCSGFQVSLLDTQSKTVVDQTHGAALLPAAHAQWTHADEWGRCAV